MKKTKVPDFLQPVLCSYDIKRLDPEKDRKIIISSILNLGTHKMTEWLFDTYTKEEILEYIKKTKINEWNKKSYNYWKLMLFPK